MKCVRVCRTEYGSMKKGECWHSAMSVIAYTSLVRPVLEYGSTCWDPCTEGQVNALDRIQKKASQFTNHTKDSDWETLAQCRTITRLCTICNPLNAKLNPICHLLALLGAHHILHVSGIRVKAYCGERAWKAISDSLRRT